MREDFSFLWKLRGRIPVEALGLRQYREWLDGELARIDAVRRDAEEKAAPQVAAALKETMARAEAYGARSPRYTHERGIGAASATLSPLTRRVFQPSCQAAPWRLTNFLRHANDLLDPDPLLDPVCKAIGTVEAHSKRILQRWTSHAATPVWKD